MGGTHTGRGPAGRGPIGGYGLPRWPGLQQGRYMLPFAYGFWGWLHRGPHEGAEYEGAALCGPLLHVPQGAA